MLRDGNKSVNMGTFIQHKGVKNGLLNSNYSMRPKDYFTTAMLAAMVFQAKY